MTTTSADNPSSIFKAGKLKPGIYRIQNLYTGTYVDIHDHSRDVCCRPATALAEGRGLWEIKPLGAGYSVQRIEPGKPEQFSVPLHGLGDEARPSLGVTPYPMAWRLVIADEEQYRGFEYIRLFWETTNLVWDLCGGKSDDGRAVLLCADKPPSEGVASWRVWKLIPVKVEGASTPSQLLSEILGSSSPPLYDGDTAGEFTTRTQHTESEHDEFGTIVNEVTVTTTTVTTRKKYRVEDA